MKSSKTLYLALIILAPFLLIFYKVGIKKISFIPQTSSHQWNVELVYDLKPILEENEKSRVISLPMISSWHNQKIDVKEIVSPYEYTLTTAYGTRSLDIMSSDIKNTTNPGKISVFATFAKKPTAQGKQIRTKTYADKNDIKKKYTSRAGLKDEHYALLEDLSQKIIGSDDDTFEKVRKIYYYVTEEILTNSSVDSIEEALSLGEGSDWVRAQVFTHLARINKIPTRINLVYRYEKPTMKTQMSPLKRNYLPEVAIGDYWYPVDIINNTFMKVPASHFIVYQDAEAVRKYFINKSIYLNIAPIMVNKVDSDVYKNKLASVSRILSYFSLHTLPLSQQSLFYVILLIPIGTLILSISRNMIGINSFGIFTPILLSLFFVESSLLIGFIFFAVIVLIGFAQRYILDKFYLLAVPRLSILLTLVILVYMLFTLVFYQQFFMKADSGSLSYFPIVIITVFIERFSVNFIEEGMRATLKTLLGTFIVSVFCYLIFQSEILKLTLFNHPELLFSVIGLNFIVGSYKGYRLTEILRFKELTEGTHV